MAEYIERKLNILIACEESQRVTIEFRKLGHNAFSCDVMECSGGHPEWHIQQDVLPLINGNCSFVTADGSKHTINEKWDMLIAFPPCTYLSNVCTRQFSLNATPPEEVVKRWELRAKASIFFMRFFSADCEKIAVENPVGFMNTNFRKPDQIIEPYFFAESENDCDNYVTKRTCLWLKNLPLLKKQNDLPKPKPYGSYMAKCGKKKNICWEMKVTGATNKERSKNRSKTFPGIAKAMAEQWG